VRTLAARAQQAPLPATGILDPEVT